MPHLQPTPLPDVADDLRIVAARPPAVEPGTGAWRALLRRVRGTRERLDLPASGPAPRSLQVFRGVVAVGAFVWVVDGVLEGLRANIKFAGVPLAIGILSLALCGQIGRTRTDARLRRTDRGNTLVWALIPLGAIGLLFRIAWLLAGDRSM